MPRSCTHVQQGALPPTPLTVDACTSCVAEGRHDWVHLRECQQCGHVGCCDNSPARHATRHARTTDHPLVRSLEPNELWWYCYIDDIAFEIEGAPLPPTRRS